MGEAVQPLPFIWRGRCPAVDSIPGSHILSSLAQGAHGGEGG